MSEPEQAAIDDIAAALNATGTYRKPWRGSACTSATAEASLQHIGRTLARTARDVTRRGRREPASRGRLRIPGRSGHPGRTSPVVGQDPVELAARIDVELLEHLAQVVVDRVRAKEELGGNLLVGQAFTGQTGDPGFL